MFRKLKYTVAVIMIITVSIISMSSCIKNEINLDGSNLSFKSDVYSIDKNVSWYWIFKQGSILRIIVQETTLIDNQYVDRFYLYSLENDMLSEPVHLEVDSANAFCAVGDDRIACYSGSGGYALFNLEGNCITEFYGTSPEFYGLGDVESSSDGFVSLTSLQATLFDYDGNCIGEVDFGETHFLSEEKGYFEYSNDKYISVDCGGGRTEFYKLDFNRNELVYVADNTTFGLSDDMSVYRYGGYVYDETNGFLGKLNFNTVKIDTIALIENCIITPPEFLVSSNIHTHFLSDTEFAKVYRYDCDRTDIVIISQSDEDFSNRIKLTIQGHGLNEDFTLLWAIYLYNSSQNNYLVCARDYGAKYMYNTAEEAQQAKLQLIAEFESGNTPDLFYGNDFDYNYWGRNGIVLDIMDYADTSIFDDLSPQISSIILNDNACYHIFAGYVLFGFVGNKTTYPLENYAIGDLPVLQSYLERWPDMSSVDLADLMIRYSLNSGIDINAVLNPNNIQSILELAINNGGSPFEASSWGDYVGISCNDYSLCLSYISGNIRDFSYFRNIVGDDLMFVGFPSLCESYHVLNPISDVAISSNTENVDACIDFISILLSEEVQSKNFLSNTIPVSQSIFEEYIDYMRNPNSIPEYEYTYRSLATTTYPYLDEGGYLVSYEGNIQLSESEIVNYIEFISSVDTIDNIDWGVYNIIREELVSYYNSEKGIDEIALSLSSRLGVYYQENYT